MSLPSAPVSQDSSAAAASAAPAKKSPLWRRLLLLLALAIIATTIWQLLSLQQNSKPVGRPLAYARTHLHTVVLSSRPGVVYLGTHYGLFTSTDGGRTWPQSQGALEKNMITSIALSPAHPDLLAVLAIPTEVGQRAGVYFSADAGKTWRFTLPENLSSSAYPYALQSDPTGQNRFYLFLTYGGWFETRDLGLHWHAITSGSLASIQTPSLLVDPANPDHLLMGGNQGLFESRNDGQSWQQITSVQGSVLALAGSLSPEAASGGLYCSTDRGLYHWQSGQDSFTQVSPLSMTSSPTRMVQSADGTAFYALSGSDLWFTADQGKHWRRIWQFSRSDLISLVLNPNNPHELLAGFFSPAVVLRSGDAGKSWQTLAS